MHSSLWLLLPVQTADCQPAKDGAAESLLAFCLQETGFTPHHQSISPHPHRSFFISCHSATSTHDGKTGQTCCSKIDTERATQDHGDLR